MIKISPLLDVGSLQMTSNDTYKMLGAGFGIGVGIGVGIGIGLGLGWRLVGDWLE